MPFCRTRRAPRTKRVALTETRGPVRTASNFLSGGLHGPEADRYGFPAGGAVSGHTHMDRFLPVVVEVFGDDWVGRGHVSVYFESPVSDGTEVQVVVERDGDAPAATTRLTRVADGTVVAAGTVGVTTDGTRLRTMDLRVVDSDSLSILRGVHPGQVLAEGTRSAPSKRQIERIRAGEIDDPLPCWLDASQWGAVVASPATIAFALVSPEGGGSPDARWIHAHHEGVATMFGAIEVSCSAGPVFLDREYHIVSSVAGVGESPRTEYCWWDSTIQDLSGRLVATTRVLTRAFKPSAARA